MPNNGIDFLKCVDRETGEDIEFPPEIMNKLNKLYYYYVSDMTRYGVFFHDENFNRIDPATVKYDEEGKPIL